MGGNSITTEDRRRVLDWRERVLIVHDPVTFTRNLTLDMLRLAGARRLKSADNPNAAAWLMRETRDPVLITDWRREFSAGPGLIRSLRRSGARESVAPVLLLSDRRPLGDVEDARDAGADSIAVRPVATQAFIDRLKEITARPRRFIQCARFTGPDRRAAHAREVEPEFKRGADVAAGRTTEIDAARAQARTIIFEKLRRNDPLAARVGRSMERFLGQMTGLDPRSAEIIQLHRAALGKLDDQRTADARVRLDIVAGLERLVERRTAAA